MRGAISARERPYMVLQPQGHPGNAALLVLPAVEPEVRFLVEEDIPSLPHGFDRHPAITCHSMVCIQGLHDSAAIPASVTRNSRSSPKRVGRSVGPPSGGGPERRGMVADVRAASADRSNARRASRARSVCHFQRETPCRIALDLGSPFLLGRLRPPRIGTPR